MVDGVVPEKGIDLVHSKEVAMESAARRSHRDTTVYSSEDVSHNRASSRINKTTGRTLAKGIQLYRLWFRYLKLALELEEMKVSLVVRNQNPKITNWRTQPNVPQKVIDKATHTEGGSKSAGLGSQTALFREKLIEKVKVKKSEYKGWDLDRVLTESFNEWWFGSSVL